MTLIDWTEMRGGENKTELKVTYQQTKTQGHSSGFGATYNGSF